MKILVATEKPFAKAATEGIRKIATNAGMELALLESYTSVDALCEAVRDADALIVRSDKVTSAVIESAPKLKIVVRAGAGFDNLDLEACTRSNVVAMNTPGQNSNAVAELALGFMIFMARAQFGGAGTEISGKTLGIHAYGNVGRLVARAGQALGMHVVAYDPYVQDCLFDTDGVDRVDSVDKLYAKADYLSLHIPSTAQTKGSIGYQLAMSMPKGATIVNTARREVIDELGLIKAMEERVDLKYVTDVAPEAKVEFADKFGKRFFATPKKMGAETSEANVNAGLAAARQIVAFLKEDDRTFQLNK